MVDIPTSYLAKALFAAVNNAWSRSGWYGQVSNLGIEQVECDERRVGY